LTYLTTFFPSFDKSRVTVKLAPFNVRLQAFFDYIIVKIYGFYSYYSI